MTIEIRARRTPWDRDIELAVLDRTDDRSGAIGRLTFEAIPVGMTFGGPTLTIDQNAAQQLIDELWQCGLRPSEGTGSAGSLAATERHLKDMQSIAMGLLRKDGVEVGK